MAFQQPQQRPPALRPAIHVRQASDQQLPASPVRRRLVEESQEWILFSPAQQDERSRTCTSETPRTATHLSDFGSLETHVRSQPAVDDEDRHLTDLQGELDGDSDDEQAELDSLDDGLHAFHHPYSTSSNPLDQSGGTVLPRHDGFGMFPSAGGLQEQLWQFERYNPQRKRHARRRSSVQKQLDAIEAEQIVDVDDERTERIEKWRLDQSKAVLDEIEKETRRRRRRVSRMGASVSIDATPKSLHETGLHRQPEPADPADVERQSESFWQRITRKVIQDLIGLDENTLSVILGESLAADTSPTPRQSSPLAAAVSRESRVSFGDPGYDWEVKLLDRIARELGILVNHLSGHEGAFSTYLRTQDDPDYAGLGRTVRDTPLRQPSLRQRRRQQSGRVQLATGDPMFSPTLLQGPVSATDAPDSSLWGIEEEPMPDADTPSKEYWEREVDFNLIFTYLRNRFSQLLPYRQPTPNHTSTGPLPASWTTAPSPSPSAAVAAATAAREASLRRAELIRRQHPLVSRAAAQQQQARRRLIHHESMLRRQLAQRRNGSSSCASQSTRRSRHSRSASSRHFWDLGGSVGSPGSGAVLSTGFGGWGDV